MELPPAAPRKLRQLKRGKLLAQALLAVVGCDHALVHQRSRGRRERLDHLVQVLVYTCGGVYMVHEHVIT